MSCKPKHVLYSACCILIVLLIIAVLLGILLEWKKLADDSNDNAPLPPIELSSPSSPPSPSPSPSITPSQSSSPSPRSPLQPEDVGPIGLPFDLVTMHQKAAVFSFTNSSEKIPNTDLWKPYEANIYPTPYTYLGNISETFFMIEDYQQFISASFEGSSGLWGSKESAFSTWTNSYIQEDYSFSICHSTWAIFTAVLSSIEDIPLSETFLIDLNRVNIALDGEYSFSLIQTYILEKYGTHVPFSADYGGSILFASYLMNCIARQYSQTWVMQQTEALFDLMVDGTTTTTVNNVMYDANYHAQSLKVTGGPSISGASLTPEMVAQWVPQIGENPVYLGQSGYWVKLSDIIPPNLSDLAEMISQAIDEYISSSIPEQSQITQYIYPYIPPLDYAGEKCEGSCTDTCLGQNACPGQGSCQYAFGLNVESNSDACGYDDDDCSFQDNCIRKLQGEGYCAMPAHDCHRTCWASGIADAYPTRVACASPATCFPYSS